MNDYKELITALSCCQHIPSNCVDCPLSNSESFEPFTHNCEVKLHNLALTAIEQLVKERDAYAKCFRIMRTDEPFTNHAVFKVDYKDLICHTEEEIANALVYGFARIISEQRGVREAEHG